MLLARVEHGSRASQVVLNCRRGRVRAAEYAPRGPFRLLERRHGFAEIVERRAVILQTFSAANNYAMSLARLKRFKEARSVLRKLMPVVRRVLGESDDLTLKMRSVYAEALYKDASSTLDDLRESVATLEELNRTARRVLGNAHPLTTAFEGDLRAARAALGK